MKIVIRADCKVDEKYGETIPKNIMYDLECAIIHFLVESGHTNVNVKAAYHVEFDKKTDSAWDSDLREK